VTEEVSSPSSLTAEIPVAPGCQKGKSRTGLGSAPAPTLLAQRCPLVIYPLIDHLERSKMRCEKRENDLEYKITTAP
jgi:hypothetical protein